MAKRPVIHRDKTFEYQGETWRVQEYGDRLGRGYLFVRVSDGVEADGGWFSMADVRDALAEHAANDWPLYEGPEER